MRRRLDAELVRRGLCPSREAAQRAIRESQVLVGGAVAEKASRLVDPGEPVRLVGPRPRFVSRGGEKLHGALEHFGIDPAGLWAFDAGASTGGFTDCLLQRGARGVVAADVGFGQLHEKIRADTRVEVHEHVNLRTVDVPTFFGGRRFPLIVGDLSFISLRSLVPNFMALSAAGASLVLLVKPQFEAGRAEVAKGKGVIREPAVWLRALEEVMGTFLSQGATMMGAMTSPITGTDGNVEFLVHLRAPSRLSEISEGLEGGLQTSVMARPLPGSGTPGSGTPGSGTPGSGLAPSGTAVSAVLEPRMGPSPVARPTEREQVLLVQVVAQAAEREGLAAFPETFATTEPNEITEPNENTGVTDGLLEPVGPGRSPEEETRG
jgi:23S rRNA (cytidine1920-2'-O)/16S rRNA (cytidine1409-2'-O)-methyltransferase